MLQTFYTLPSASLFLFFLLPSSDYVQRCSFSLTMARAVVPVNTEMQAVSRKISFSQTWMLLNSKGQSLIIEVDKYAIMHRVGIHARDLRILDPLLSYPSTILGRERAIVLNLEHIKAIITAEEVLLRDPTNEKVVPFVEELCRRLSAKKDLDMNSKSGAEGNFADQRKSRLTAKAQVDVEDEPPFEFRALEVALEAVCSFLDARTTELATVTHPALDELVEKVSSRNLDQVRKLKSRMTRLTARVQKVRDELEQMLDDDSDMADLFLTRKLASAASPPGGSPEPQWVAGSPTIGSRISRASRVSGGTYGSDNDVEQLEMLLEAYFMQIDGTLNRLLTLREYIDDTEDYINIQLDNHRNQLIQLELVLSAGTVVLAMFASVAGIFGMNIPYPWNKGHNYVFKWVVIFTGIMCMACFSTIILYARHKGLVG